MIIQLSRRELVMPWRALALGANWGGSEDILLAQGELWTVCRLADFQPLTSIGPDGKEEPTAIDVSKLGMDLESYDLSPNAVQVLRQYLAARGQELLLATASLAALTRLRTASAAPVTQ